MLKPTNYSDTVKAKLCSTEESATNTVGWLPMNTLMACHECDLVVKLPERVEGGSVVACPRCQHQILATTHNPAQRTMALSLTALIMLAIAIYFPFLGFNADGQTGSISLLEASFKLFENRSLMLGVLVLLLIVVLPACYFILLIVLLASMQLGHCSPPRVFLGHVISAILPWLMADVFLIGVLVALIKLLGMADVIFGVSFWAYIGFTVLYLITTRLVDTHQLWVWVEGHRAPY